jgi:methyl-accepting chemotaxis protein
MADKGFNIFDTQYKPIPNTNPPKFTTSYDHVCPQTLQPLYDQLVSELKGGVFALCIDVNAYGPTHNKKYSNPPTGDYQKDLINSRDKRMFTDRVGSKGGKNTMQVLLQTYRRDTGELLSDLSMPIYVRDKHWGCLRVGFIPYVLLED